MKKFFNNVKARFNKATAAVKARVECAKVAVENISRFARYSGYEVRVTEDGEDFKLTLTK